MASCRPIRATGLENVFFPVAASSCVMCFLILLGRSMLKSLGLCVLCYRFAVVSCVYLKAIRDRKSVV